MESTTAVRLPKILTAFHREHPEVELIFETGTSTEMATKLLEGALDGAFIADCPDYENFHFKKAFKERLVLVGPKPLTGLPTPHSAGKGDISRISAGLQLSPANGAVSFIQWRCNQ